MKQHTIGREPPARRISNALGTAITYIVAAAIGIAVIAIALFFVYGLVDALVAWATQPTLPCTDCAP